VDAAVSGDVANQQLGLLMLRHSVDLRSQPMEVREAVVADLNRAGVPAKIGEPMRVTEPGQVQTVISVLKKHDLLPEDVTVETV
jgi:hypothetical protein